RGSPLRTSPQETHKREARRGARLSAFHHGTCCSEQTPQLSSRTRFLGLGRGARSRWFERSCTSQRALPAPSCPSPATKSQTGHHAGRAFSRSRPGAEVTSPRPREPLSLRQPELPADVLSVSEIRCALVTERGTDVKGKVARAVTKFPHLPWRGRACPGLDPGSSRQRVGAKRRR